MSALPNILVVDDDEVFRSRMARGLEARGYEVRTADGVAAAIELAHQECPEWALVDLRMAEGNGLDLIRELVRLDPHTKIVMLTGYGSIATAVEAIRNGAVNYLAKPADVDEVLAAFERRDSAPAEPVVPPTEVPSLARVEWEHIQRVLSDCGGNISQAARLLGLHRRSLQRKLSKYPVRR